MKALLTSIFFISFVASIAQAGVGFANGNEFTAHEISGRVTVQCRDFTGGLQTHFYTCRNNILIPGEFDYFIGPQGTGMGEVTLISTQSTGKVRKKYSDYDFEQGRSTDRFNLWIESLFQRPLLDLGFNNVEYIVTDSYGTEVAKGAFRAIVQEGESFTCGPQTIVDMGGTYCTNPSAACVKYFRDQNYCQP